MFRKFFSKMKSEEGQGLVEYALIIVLVSVVCIGLLATMGGNVGAVFTRISTELVAAL